MRDADAVAAAVLPNYDNIQEALDIWNNPQLLEKASHEFREKSTVATIQSGWQLDGSKESNVDSNSKSETNLVANSAAIAQRTYGGVGSTSPVQIFSDNEGEYAHEVNDPSLYRKLLAQSKINSKYGACVRVHDVEVYKNKRLFITPSGNSGAAISASGELTAIFSSPNSKKGECGKLIQLAIKHGAIKTAALDTILPDYYANHGFRAVVKMPWSTKISSQLPDWDKEVFGEFNAGEPDLVFMVLDQERRLGPFTDYSSSIRSSLTLEANDFQDAENAQDAALKLIAIRSSAASA